MSENLFICHHDIKGQKWGVRRYQNFDGSLTQAGLKRYNASSEAYEKANAKYRDAKQKYKSGSGSESDYVNSKIERNKAKQKMDKDYRHLKQDKLADQGKKLYAEGHTITGDWFATKVLATIGGAAISAAGYNNRNKIFDDKVTTFLAGVGIAASLGASAKKAVDYDRARKLRAYYSHTSKY